MNENEIAESAECRIENDSFVFGNGHFKIPVQECATHEATLRSALRLTQETWITRRMLGEFISLALQTNSRRKR